MRSFYFPQDPTFYRWLDIIQTNAAQVFILSIFTTLSLVYISAFLVGCLAAYYCLFVLFGAVEILAFMYHTLG